jgi:hypothetical protein
VPFARLERRVIEFEIYLKKNRGPQDRGSALPTYWVYWRSGADAKS